MYWEYYTRKNCFSISFKNSFSKTTKNFCEKMNLFSQNTIKDKSIHKYTDNNLLKKWKALIEKKIM